MQRNMTQAKCGSDILKYFSDPSLLIFIPFCNPSPWVWVRFADFLLTMSITKIHGRSSWMSFQRPDYIAVFSVLQAPFSLWIIYSWENQLPCHEAALWKGPCEWAQKQILSPIQRSLKISAALVNITNYWLLRYLEPKTSS